MSNQIGHMTLANGERYPYLRKGTPLRGGNSLVATGAEAGASIADAASGTKTWDFSEPGVLDRLVISPATAGMAITELKIDNDSLVTGYVPAGMFAHDAIQAPKLGHVVGTQTDASYTIANDTGGAVIPYAAFTAKAIDPQQFKPGSNVYRPGRSLIAIGGPAITSVAAGGTEVLSFDITEAGVLGRLFLDWTGDLEELVVASVKHNNDELLTGKVPGSLFAHDCPFSEVFGHYVAIRDKLTITVTNLDGANAAEVLAGFSCL